MAKFFGNLHAVLGVGFVAALALIFVVPANGDLEQQTIRWLHTFFGILWIGLLYYFNFVQIPTMPKIPAELKPGVSKHIAPSALFFFRWGAALTVLFGLIIAFRAGYLVDALTLNENFRLIGIGMWLALIMAFNVWFVIWPAQQKALGMVEADDATKAAAATRAMMFSRTNTLLSIPMLYAMIGFNGG
ncbi:MAG TPA: urate hydroxylase PuuD [Sphingorhabdus sp.]|nr:urate hydroxylase PuuD [Sphingorhabdus sp.]